MATYRFPILIWEDLSGGYTGRLVEDETAPAAYGNTPAEVTSQLKEYAEWLYHEQWWREGPDFTDPSLIHIRVELQPEYKNNDKVYICKETVALKVPCIYGKNSEGLMVCSLPTLKEKFYFPESGNLKDLVIHYTRENLRGSSPYVVSRFLQPKSVELSEIVIHAQIRAPHSKRTEELETLLAIAEPMGDKKLRRRYSRAWEREREVAELIDRLVRDNANILIVGESGTGKTALLIDAVHQIEFGTEAETTKTKVDNVLQSYKHWMTSGGKIIAGMMYLGQWQARCEQIIRELHRIGGVLCINNLLELVQTGTGDVTESIAYFLMPYLQRSELRMVAEVTPAELDACKKLIPGLADMFQIIYIKPLVRDQAIKVLSRQTQSNNRKIEITPEVPSTVYRLFRRFQPYHSFPGKPSVFLHNCLETSVRNGIEKITSEVITDHFARQTGLPHHLLLDDIQISFSDIVEYFNKEIIGQEQPCEAIARLISVFKAGVHDPNRPLGVMLFCGPTGVGKTELAKAASRYLFGHGDSPPSSNHNSRLIRIDMSEYSGWYGAQRLLTSPNGEPSDFIKQIRSQPFSIVLFDEIEKASPDIFDILLSVFDEGRLTDKFGRVTIFRSSVIIMTSNLGADKLKSVGFDKDGKPSYSREAMNFFRPEFFNRIDSIVQFNPLSKEMMRLITQKELKSISDREGLKLNNIKVEWDESLVEYLIEKGFDKRYGARPLQRTIESEVTTRLAQFLIEYPESKRCTLYIKVSNNQPEIDLIF